MAMPTPPKNDNGVLIVSKGDFARKVCDALSSGGCDARVVSDPEEARKTLFDGIHRAMVLDTCMEGFDAYKALAEKTGERLLEKIPVFLISDSREPIDIARIPKECKVDFINPMYIGVNDAAELVKKSIGR